MRPVGPAAPPVRLDDATSIRTGLAFHLSFAGQRLAPNGTLRIRRGRQAMAGDQQWAGWHRLLPAFLEGAIMTGEGFTIAFDEGGPLEDFSIRVEISERAMNVWHWTARFRGQALFEGDAAIPSSAAAISLDVVCHWLAHSPGGEQTNVCPLDN